MLGDVLRAEREKQNLTIKDIEKGTSIRSLYIEAIEKGDYKSLPGEVYTKGFIRNYATFLNLDPEKMLYKYKEEVQPDKLAEEEAAKAERESAASAYTSSRYNFSSGSDFKERVENSRGSQNVLAGILVAVLVAGGAYMMFGDTIGKMFAEEKPVKQTVQTQKKAPEPAAKAEQPKQETKKYEDVEVAAVFSERCWTKVIVDGKTVYEGTAEKDEKMSWKGKDNVEIVAGNASAIDVTYNGQKVGSFGADGEVVSKRFTKEKVENVE